MVKLSIIIPAYNEEDRIKETLEAYCDFFSGKIDFELQVIVNGCTDNTLGVVKNVAKKHKQVRYVDIGKVASKGAAVNYGFKIANGELIGFVDADMATSPEAFHDLIENIGDYEGIFASRYIKGAVQKPRQSFMRRVASRVFNFIVRSLFLFLIW